VFDTSEMFEKHYEDYCAQIANVDLGSIRERLGIDHGGEKMLIPFFNRNYCGFKGWNRGCIGQQTRLHGLCHPFQVYPAVPRAIAPMIRVGCESGCVEASGDVVEVMQGGLRISRSAGGWAPTDSPNKSRLPPK